MGLSPPLFGREKSLVAIVLAQRINMPEIPPSHKTNIQRGSGFRGCVKNAVIPAREDARGGFAAQHKMNPDFAFEK